MLASNSLILFISEGSAALLTMGMGLLLARLFDVSDFGRYTTALAFATLLGVLVDSGMGMVAARDIARRQSSDLSQLDQIFSWRLWMILAACVISPFLSRWALPSWSIRRIALWLTPGVLLIGVTDFFCWIFKGAQRALWCASLQVSSRVLLLILAVLAVRGPHPMTSLLLAYGITGTFMTVAGLIVLSRSIRRPRWVRLPPEFFRKTLPGIYQMGVILILSVAFTRVDLLIVARLRGSMQAGLYAAAGRVIDALRLIPTVVYSVYLPVFSAAHNEPGLLRPAFQQAYDFLLILSITIVLVGSALARPLFVHVLGARYGGAVACFHPLIWSCVLMFSNILMFSLLFARGDHRTPFVGIVGAIVIESILDLIFVPRFGIIAAAWARLAAETFNGLTLAWGVWRNGLFLSSTALFWRPAFLIGACVAVALALQHQRLVFQLLLPWTVFMTLALVSGVGRSTLKKGALV